MNVEDFILTPEQIEASHRQARRRRFEAIVEHCSYLIVHLFEHGPSTNWEIARARHGRTPTETERDRVRRDAKVLASNGVVVKAGEIREPGGRGVSWVWALRETPATTRARQLITQQR